MNTVHYIWIGGEIPNRYLNNFKKCNQLNKSFHFNIWKDNDCLALVKEYDLLDIFTPLSFIGKCNFLKYLVLHKFGGIYTDFDIEWKIPFTKIMNDYNLDNVDIIISTSNNPLLIDDPFIISKPNIFGSCITYCMNRTNLKYDGDILVKTGRKEIHQLEPFGPFGLTEWIRNNKISFNSFSQQDLLDHKGYFGIHEQKSNWKAK